MPQARYVGAALPQGHRVQVGFPAGIGAIAGQVEGQLGDAIRQLAPGPQPRVGEYLQHRGVLGQDLGGKGPHPPAAGRGDQVLEQQRRYPPMVGMVGDGERDLRRAGPAFGLVAGYAHQVPGQPGQ